MPALRITVDGHESLIDLDGLMLSELEVLEEHAGVDLQQLNDSASLGKVRFIGHMLWLADLRRAVEKQGITLMEAALKSPRDRFDVGVGSIRMELVDDPKSAGPTGTPITRTRPTGSSAPRRRSATSVSARSDGSPNS
jgi:hypothetical protein